MTTSTKILNLWLKLEMKNMSSNMKLAARRRKKKGLLTQFSILLFIYIYIIFNLFRLCQYAKPKQNKWYWNWLLLSFIYDWHKFKYFNIKITVSNANYYFLKHANQNGLIVMNQFAMLFSGFMLTSVATSVEKKVCLLDMKQGLLLFHFLSTLILKVLIRNG